MSMGVLIVDTCQRVRPANYRKTGADLEMLVSGEWIVVPMDTIQYRTLEGDNGETAGGHWCGRERGQLGSTLTFLRNPAAKFVLA
jgi:hypothetical protein